MLTFSSKFDLCFNGAENIYGKKEHCIVIIFGPRTLVRYQIILLGDRGTVV